MRIYSFFLPFGSTASTVIWSSMPNCFIASFINKPFRFLKNCFKVLFGKYSWIGYCDVKDNEKSKLPKIKKGIFDPSASISRNGLTEEEKEHLNLMYARDYSLSKDIHFFLRALRK